MNLFHPTRLIDLNRQYPGRQMPRRADCSGQALLEFALVAVIMLLLLMGMIDYGRIMMTRQTLINITREGSNLAARGVGITNVVDTMVISAQPLNITSNGFIILSTVSRDSSGIPRLIAQVTRGGMVSTSKIGVVGATGPDVHLPSTQVPQTNMSVYITEVFYRFRASTPVGNLLGRSMDGILYDAAYF